jgi:hypothetical protein
MSDNKNVGRHVTIMVRPDTCQYGPPRMNSASVVTQLTTTTTIIATRSVQSNNMLRSNRTRLPADVFSINDRVKCVNPRSKHYGHTASVIGMGKARLNVAFENGHVGKFIDWRDAELLSRPTDNASTTPSIQDTTSTSASPSEHAATDLQQLTSLMECMAFTSATVISLNSEDPERMKELLTQFDRAVRVNVRNIANMRQANHDGSPPSRSSLP